MTHASGSTGKEAAAVALGCAMVPDQNLLYVAGDVENGAVLEGATESAGADDIFVAILVQTFGFWRAIACSPSCETTPVSEQSCARHGTRERRLAHGRHGE